MAKLNLKSMKKSTKDHIITFAMVVVVYIIVQVMITTGKDFLFQCVPIRSWQLV